ncbi:MAG: L-fucose/L-arabinose isomerase family protein [Verrucomicrobia bacterium]|nr:L-fucose/L-arabinose isomerase family protein [Verrucomicrobiota bacterium]
MTRKIVQGEITPKGKLGLFGIGLAAYWPQFKGLKPRLAGYQGLVAMRLGKFCEVVDVGLVDTAPKAAEAGELFARESVELVLCYVATYATSSQVLPAVQKAGVPVLILNLQAASALDYPKTDTGEWLANCCACCVPEIACAFARSRIDFHVVTGVLGVKGGKFGEAAPDHHDSVRAWQEISDWVRAASTVSRLKRSRIGSLGHTYPGMLDLNSDFTQHTAQLGTHIELLEMCDLAARLPKPGDRAVAAKLREAKAVFDISKDSPSDPLARAPAPDQLQWACRVAVALDRLVADFDLHGLAYYYRGLDGNEYERLAAGLILGCSLLTARGVPCSGEGDLKNCQAMKILDLLGCGGSYTEFYVMDFDEDFLLMGHDGPFHLGIAEGKPILRGLGLYHGKRGSGVSVEAHVKLGPVTLLALTQTADGQLKLLAAQGECVVGPTLQIGNTNSRIKFHRGMRSFVNGWCLEGPTHHCALGVGAGVPVVRNVASLLKLPFVEVG